jgi:hypothetical protein
MPSHLLDRTLDFGKRAALDLGGYFSTQMTCIPAAAVIKSTLWTAPASHTHQCPTGRASKIRPSTIILPIELTVQVAGQFAP